MPTKIEIVCFGVDRPWPARACAELHAEYLGHSHICQFGMPFMEGFFYRALPEQGLLFGSGAFVDGRLAGITTITNDAEGFMRRAVRRQPIRLAASLALSLLQNPARVKPLAEVFRLNRNRVREPYPVWEGMTKVTRKEYTDPEFKRQYGSISTAMTVVLFHNLIRKYDNFEIRSVIERDNTRMRTRLSHMGYKYVKDIEGFPRPSVELRINIRDHRLYPRFAEGLKGGLLPTDDAS